MRRLSRRSRVTLEGTNALTIREARALIAAGHLALESTAPIMQGNAANVAIEDAMEKLADGLIAAGQDPAAVARLMNPDPPPTLEKPHVR